MFCAATSSVISLIFSVLFSVYRWRTQGALRLHLCPSVLIHLLELVAPSQVHQDGIKLLIAKMRAVHQHQAVLDHQRIVLSAWVLWPISLLPTVVAISSVLYAFWNGQRWVDFISDRVCISSYSPNQLLTLIIDCAIFNVFSNCIPANKHSCLTHVLWLQVKAECPLCKVAFDSIIHNVRSQDDYDQYHVVRQPPPMAPTLSSVVLYSRYIFQ